jgi:ankyrin repeat protein
VFLLHNPLSVLEAPPSLVKIQTLVEEYPKSLQMATPKENLPLHCACIFGPKLDVIRYLVQEYPTSLKVTNKSGFLPLHHACNRNAPLDLDVVRYLVEEYPASLKVTNKSGFLPLHHTCIGGAPLDIFRYLVQSYPESLKVTNKNGWLPLHYAFSYRHHSPLEIVRYLVEEYPESLQVTDGRGVKPIGWAKKPLEGEEPLHDVLAWLKSFEPLPSPQLSVIHDVVAWLKSTMAGGVAFDPLSSSQPSVQPDNSPFSPDKETLVHPIALDPPVSSQQPSPSLHPVTSSSFDQKSSSQNPSLTASLTATALPSEENTDTMQFHMNPTKVTEGADFAANSAQFGEEGST